MLRGINRQVIFEDDEDCEKYLQCLKECKAANGFVLYAYCLMGNHIHLLMKEMKEPLELIFKRIGSRYVFWYNWKYKRSGHLFQDRFKSEPINDDRQFIAVLRYYISKSCKSKNMWASGRISMEQLPISWIERFSYWYKWDKRNNHNRTTANADKWTNGWELHWYIAWNLINRWGSYWIIKGTERNRGCEQVFNATAW